MTARVASVAVWVAFLVLVLLAVASLPGPFSGGGR